MLKYCLFSHKESLETNAEPSDGMMMISLPLKDSAKLLPC